MASKYLDGAVGPKMVIGSDTIVELNGRILEKPKDKDDAFAMLKSLSGNQHLVHSGVSIFTNACGSSEPAALWFETTEVEFHSLSDSEIRAYIESGELMVSSLSYTIF